MAKKKSDKQAKLLRELESHPLVERACRKINIARSTFYRWCAEDFRFKLDVELAQEKGRDKLNDFTESKLLECINNGNLHAMTFWLTHNHKLYRPQTGQSYVEENEFLRDNLVKLEKLFDDFIHNIGIDRLLMFAGQDPEEFRAKVKEEQAMMPYLPSIVYNNKRLDSQQKYAQKRS